MLYDIIITVKKMEYQEKKYINRLVDKKIEEYLSVFGAVCIEGPKWCGKTWSSSKYAKTITYMDDDDNIAIAEIDPKAIFTKNLEERPQLIDEWHLVPSIWDSVRRECDKSTIKGNFILTGSTTLSNKERMKSIKHSGIGRIGHINMYTMSLYESGDSSGKASILDMLNSTQDSMKTKDISLEEISKFIIRGGWPENIKVSDDKISIIPRSYINSIIENDMNEDGNFRRDKNKMKMLLRSLARNETTIVSNKSIVRDIEDNESDEDLLSSRDTISSYLDILDRLHVIENQESYSENYRSSKRVGKSSKRHYTDPSLACASLELTVEKLLKDLKTFGFMFEALVERDLRIYMDYLDGHLYHFRDNVSGLEVDAILEFGGGDYAAVEIKLGFNQVDDAKKNLLKFYDNMLVKPKFMCIIVGKCSSILRDKETGIYIIPITALKP